MLVQCFYFSTVIWIYKTGFSFCTVTLDETSFSDLGFKMSVYSYGPGTKNRSLLTLTWLMNFAL